ncbi:hypothetical protein CMV_017645 [Castanea mollissima]|uniref:Uncharacterized protein n=1 Tax=Castanea mollissima TaxID=60419 RepID=A0A8J4QSR5_9ROSI|nr:hypothetical protein CMV_017645 [Castanea mollissima]
MVSTIFVDVILPLTLDIEKFAIVINMDTVFSVSEEIELITSLPLARGSSDDKLIWPHVSSGIYSVKSGYNFLSKEKVSASLDNFRAPQLQGLWKQIWTCKVPNKLQYGIQPPPGIFATQQISPASLTWSN